jgi:diguanylate cyclase (GGDEF)-like protein
MAIFGIVNLFQGNVLTFIVIFLSCSGLLGGLLLLGRLQNSRVIYRANGALFVLLIFYMMAIGGEGGSKILWMYTFPLIAHFIFGKREGLFWNGIILLITLLAFWGPLKGVMDYTYPYSFKIRFLVTYLMVSAITYWFEYSRFYYRSKIVEKNRILEEEKAHLNHEIKERQRLERELRRLASTDPLTGAANRRHFMDVAHKEFYRFKRYHHNLALAIMDIDHFKAINDTYGHPVGDEVLKALVQYCRIFLRKSDLLGRVGGEEFAVLLVESNPASAKLVADRLRQKISEIQLPVEDENLNFTVSIGISNVMEEDESVSQQLAELEKAARENVETLERLKTTLEALKERQKEDQGLAIVKVGGNIFAGNCIAGPHSKVAIQENMQRLSIMETDKPDHDGVKRWRFEFAPYR